MLWRATLVGLCALVFFFALHAKTSVYNNGAPPNVTPSTAGRLWMNGQKMESKTASFVPVVLFWMAACSLFGPYLHQEPQAPSALLVPPPRLAELQQLHRFLRPPPAQS